MTQHLRTVDVDQEADLQITHSSPLRLNIEIGHEIKAQSTVLANPMLHRK